MRKLFLIIILLVSGICGSMAQNSDQNALLKKANENYVNKEFKIASELYEQLITQGYTAAELNYNLGNAYYKQEKFTLAILNYERALKQNRNFEDARINLKLANTHLRDQIKDIPDSNITAITEQIAKGVGLNGWAVMCLIFLGIGVALIGLYFWSEGLNLRKFSFSFGIVFVVLSIIALSLGFYTENVLSQSSEAIITEQVVTVKSSPDDSGTDLFRIHEGLKVSTKDHSADWVEIRIADGRVGWVKSQTLEKI